MQDWFTFLHTLCRILLLGYFYSQCVFFEKRDHYIDLRSTCRLANSKRQEPLFPAPRSCFPLPLFNYGCSLFKLDDFRPKKKSPDWQPSLRPDPRLGGAPITVSAASTWATCVGNHGNGRIVSRHLQYNYIYVKYTLAGLIRRAPVLRTWLYAAWLGAVSASVPRGVFTTHAAPAGHARRLSWVRCGRPGLDS